LQYLAAFDVHLSDSSVTTLVTGHTPNRAEFENAILKHEYVTDRREMLL
jgi:hypothetical protein